MLADNTAFRKLKYDGAPPNEQFVLHISPPARPSILSLSTSMSKVIKRAIAKHKEKKARRDLEKDSKYIVDDIDRISSAFKQYGIFGRHCNGPDEDATEDDASSVSSFSTTATMDDNPGAGYTIDKYFYQPVGRRIEKIAFRIAMPLLSPERIFQYIEEHHVKGGRNFANFTYPLHDFKMTTVYVAGVDSLVHQTR